MHPIGGLVLDTVPQGFELRAVQDRLASPNGFSVVRVLHFQLSGEFFEHSGNLRTLLLKAFGEYQLAFLEGYFQRVLNFAFFVDVALVQQVSFTISTVLPATFFLSMEK